MSFAVIGTDTEVGKTVVCATLLLRFARQRRLAYWKPIASGSSEVRDAETVARLLGEHRAAVEILPEVYLFEAPVSPHLAARLEGRTLDPGVVARAFDEHRAANQGRAMIVEGVGGLLVPLTDDGFLFPGVLSGLGLPCVVVARSTLGTINHTLLTLEAARLRGLRVGGVILNGPPDAENRRAIERFGQTEVLGELPRLAALSPEALAEAAARLDPEGRLLALLDDGAA